MAFNSMQSYFTILLEIILGIANAVSEIIFIHYQLYLTPYFFLY